MIEKDIISRASQIVTRHLEEMDLAGVEATILDRTDMVEISAALAIAGVLCKANGEVD